MGQIIDKCGKCNLIHNRQMTCENAARRILNRDEPQFLDCVCGARLTVVSGLPRLPRDCQEHLTGTGREKRWTYGVIAFAEGSCC